MSSYGHGRRFPARRRGPVRSARARSVAPAAQIVTLPGVRAQPVSPWLRSPVRRAIDVTTAAVALLVGSPILVVALVAIRLETHGHALYRQRRVGRDGAPFEVYKLRTMVAGAESMGAGLAVNEGDERITRVGALLRRTSLDELPNLFNVLRGEMSLIGPRPTVQVQVDRYSDRQRGRLACLPGITGWAQINGRASLPWKDRIELDLWYIEHASPAVDLRIMLRTARMAVTGHGLYKGETGGWGR
jgi:lipopolysaccharide/colanic/teichoic acid biosynthesis glycosyltransferase